MAKKYKGFKGAGMRVQKMAKYKTDKLVRQYFGEWLANGCKVKRKGD